MRKPRLLFVSTVFPYPLDTGGRIRTAQVLRGLKGGAFTTTLACPATVPQLRDCGAPSGELADASAHWVVGERTRWSSVSRLRYLASDLPIPVVTDRSSRGSDLVRRLLAAEPDVVVADFPHAMVLLAGASLPSKLVIFTHNVEADIFRRHRDVATNPIKKLIWEDQRKKMVAFERWALGQANTVIAVSSRDADQFRTVYGVESVEVIPTGVDLEYFTFREPPQASKQVVFTGSMDWMANIDGVRFLLREVWPHVYRADPQISMVIVGRSPPESLIREARDSGFPWSFTGWVADTRPFVWDSAAFVVPLRVAGGTRLKVWEGMALGCPVVSTSIGVEGLPVQCGEHFLGGDDPIELAAKLVQLVGDPLLRVRLAARARSYVEENFSYKVAANQFEDICLRTLARDV